MASGGSDRSLTEERSIWGVLGLGNPLPEYAHTRHNIGHRVVEELARRTKSRMRRRANALAATPGLGGVRFILAKSLTYMNESGLAAEGLLKKASGHQGVKASRLFKRRSGHQGVEASRLLVVCDDINLPLERVRLRRSGGDGGHKGLRSLIEVLGTGEFPRLRVGVGVLPAGEDAVTYVLGPFEEDERALVEDAVRRAADCLETVILNGLEEAMNRFNSDPVNATKGCAPMPQPG